MDCVEHYKMNARALIAKKINILMMVSFKLFSKVLDIRYVIIYEGSRISYEGFSQTDSVYTLNSLTALEKQMLLLYIYKLAIRYL